MTGPGSYLAPASGHRTPNTTSALDFGAHEFVDLENDALKDVGGVDLVFDVIGGDVKKRSAALNQGRRNAGVYRRPGRGAAH
ncbi:hypothetical protein [Streptomyces mirabilis]